MIGWLRTRVRKQPIIALYFESETVLKLYNLKARQIRRIYIPRQIVILEKRINHQT